MTLDRIDKAAGADAESGRRRSRSPKTWWTLQHVRMHARVLLLLMWGASAVNYATPGPVARNGHMKGGDYAHFYAIARLAAERDGPGLYDSAAQKRAFGEARTGFVQPDYLPFLYGPQAALLIAPFGLLPYLPSLIFWWITATAVYLACCWAAWTHAFGSAAPRRDLFLFALAYPGFWELFIYGHTTWIALACLTVFWLSLKRDRWLIAGIGIGILSYKPQLGIAVFIVLVATRRWKVIAASSATVLTQLLAAWTWFGREPFTAYWGMLSSLPRIAPLVEPQPFQICSLRGFFTILNVPLPWATIVYVAVATIVCWWLVRVWLTKSVDIAFAMLLITTILIAPHATMYDLVLLAPAFALLAGANLAPSLRSASTPPEVTTAFVNPALWPAIYFAYLVPFSGGLVREIHFQLASPVLLILLIKALRLQAATAAADAR